MSLLDKASLIVTPNAYKTSKLYSVVPNTALGDMDVVRATTPATRVNSAGLIETVGLNIPRIDYTNGSCPSILVEPQRTNLVLRSEEFDNSSWTKVSSTITANSTTAPNGILTADKLIEAATSSEHWVFQSTTNTISSATISCYMKKGERNWGFIRTRTTVNDFYAWFNLDNGTVGTVQSGITASITDVGNGWYRCVVINPNPTTGANPSVIGVSNANNVFSYLGNGTSGIYIWGAQLEAGSYPTSYIPTVASIQTRNADVISKTGITSLINSVEGSFYVETNSFVNGGSFRLFSLSDGTSNNRITIGFSIITSTLLAFLNIGGIIRVNNNISSFNQTSNNKILFRWGGGNFNVFVNGVNKLSLTSIQMPTANLFNKLSFDLGDNNSGLFEGNVKNVQLYKIALTDTECIALTTL